METGIPDMAVGAPLEETLGSSPSARGAIWILFLDDDGTVKSHQKITDGTGGFGGSLDQDDWFGSAIESIGDRDGDGIVDLAVGAMQDSDGGLAKGAVWILFMNSNGTVDDETKISSTTGGFGGSLDNFDGFGMGIAAMGDLNNDGVAEIAVGAHGDDDGNEYELPGAGGGQGAVWILYLDSDSEVEYEVKISQTAGGFGADLDVGSWFGYGMESVGDLDNDGFEDLVVGAPGDDGFGSIYTLFLNYNSFSLRTPVPTPGKNLHARTLADGGAELEFALDRAADVQVGVFDVMGRRVATPASGAFAEGQHVVRWDGRTRGGALAPSGVYFVRLESGPVAATAKVVITR